MDPYRIVCYDLSTAAQKGKEGDTPLLVSRHGIAADMVLVSTHGHWTGVNVCMCVCLFVEGREGACGPQEVNQESDGSLCVL